MTPTRATMVVYAAHDLGGALLLVALVLAGICVLAFVTAWLVPQHPGAHRARTRRRDRETGVPQGAGAHQVRR